MAGILQFDTAGTDTDGFAPVSGTFDRITVPEGMGGVYLLVSSVFRIHQATTLGMGILLNGTQAHSETNQSISGPASVNYTLDNLAIELLILNAGDTVQLINNSVSPGSNVFTSTSMSLIRLGTLF